jgi:hypothetical protein
VLGTVGELVPGRSAFVTLQVRDPDRYRSRTFGLTRIEFPLR